MQDIETRLREFIVNNFLYGKSDGDLNDRTSFMDNGIVDSTGVLELVAFLEENFGVTVEDEEMIPENLDSIASVAEYVRRKNAQAG